jgi:hypothetical protein
MVRWGGRCGAPSTLAFFAGLAMLRDAKPCLLLMFTASLLPVERIANVVKTLNAAPDDVAGDAVETPREDKAAGAAVPVRADDFRNGNLPEGPLRSCCSAAKGDLIPAGPSLIHLFKTDTPRPRPCPRPPLGVIRPKNVEWQLCFEGVYLKISKQHIVKHIQIS